MHRFFKTFCFATLFLFALSSASRGQIAGGSGEAAGTIAYAHVDGVTSNNHFLFGGSGFYNLNEVVAVGFEYGFTPLGSESVSGVTVSGNVQTYGGAGRFSFGKASRAVPYALVGFGGADEKAKAAVPGISVTASQSGFYFAVGGGATIFAGPNWGIRPEFRYERQQFGTTSVQGYQFSAFGQNDVQATVSVFYQFGGKAH